MTPDDIFYAFYETPQAFSRYLFTEVDLFSQGPGWTVLAEPCVGSGAIIRAYNSLRDGIPVLGQQRQLAGYHPSAQAHWVTGDLDPRWKRANVRGDATTEDYWKRLEDIRGVIDFTVTNPKFAIAIPTLDLALKYSRYGVAMHLRASIHEVLRGKDEPRRTWMGAHLPTGILWLPRFAYQRSKTKHEWTTDTVCACWVLWLKTGVPQFIRYAPEWVIDELDAETPGYRARMDRMTGYVAQGPRTHAETPARDVQP